MNQQKRGKIENEIIESQKLIEKVREIIADMKKADVLLAEELKKQEMFKSRTISPEFDYTYGMDILDPVVVDELNALYKSGKKYKYIPGISPLPSK